MSAICSNGNLLLAFVITLVVYVVTISLIIKKKSYPSHKKENLLNDLYKKDVIIKELLNEVRKHDEKFQLSQ